MALSSFSRLVEAETFTRLATAETDVCGVEPAQRVVAVSDGAEWIQKLFDLPCPQAIRMLDVPHAAQRLSPIAASIWGEGSAAACAWSETQITALKRDGPAKALTAVADVAAAHPQATSVAEQATYLTKRCALMDYPTYQAQGLPIASGWVESANKLVVKARLKGAGMHWQRKRVQRRRSDGGGAARLPLRRRLLRCQAGKRTRRQQTIPGSANQHCWEGCVTT